MHFEWFRWYAGTVDDKKFTVVARKAQVPRIIVLGVWQTIIEHAASREDRGSLDGYDFEENAACLEIEPDEVAHVFQAMEERGLIVDQRLKNWEKRQPQKEDETAAERKRAQRERDKLRELNAELTARLSRLERALSQNVTGCHDKSQNVTECHDREEKKREEERREEEKAAAVEPESVRTDSETPPPEPELAAAAAEVRNMPVSECRALVRKYLGQLMDSPGQTSILQDICRLYPPERIREAFEAAACSSKTQLNWVKKRLEGRVDDGRGTARGASTAGGKAKGIRPPAAADADWLGTGGT